MASRARPAFIPSAPHLGISARGNKQALCGRVGVRHAKKASTGGRMRPTMKVYDVEIDLYGKKHMIPIDEEMTLLEGIEEYGLEVLYSCRAGVCMTCAAKILEGEVDLGTASITDDLKDQGYVLTCSGFPKSEGIRLEMNHFDDAYEKQYGQYENNK